MFKAEVISALDEPDATQESVAGKFNIDQSQVSRYVKKRSQIMIDAADSYRKIIRKVGNAENMTLPCSLEKGE